jgi:hypothetical protein
MFVGARQVNSGAQTVWEVPPILLLRAERGIICEGLPPGKSLEVCLDPGIEDSWQPYLAFTSFRGTDFLFGRLVEQDWTSGSFVVFVR